MANRIGIVIVCGLGILAVLALIPIVTGLRQTSDRVVCQNHLREIVSFAVWHHAMPNDEFTPARSIRYPTGTIVVPDRAVEDRLSWFATLLPALDHKRLVPVHGNMIDIQKSWDTPPNEGYAQRRLNVLVCPASIPDVQNVTQYIGIAGLDPNAATLALDDPRGGMFRYDIAIPLDAVKDGLSQTISVTETNINLGPWMRGGPSTVRGLDPQVPSYLGVGSPFGGTHATGANCGYVDGSVRFVVNDVAREVLRAQLTIAGVGVDQVE